MDLIWGCPSAPLTTGGEEQSGEQRSRLTEMFAAADAKEVVVVEFVVLDRRATSR